MTTSGCFILCPPPLPFSTCQTSPFGIGLSESLALAFQRLHQCRLAFLVWLSLLLEAPAVAGGPFAGTRVVGVKAAARAVAGDRIAAIATIDCARSHITPTRKESTAQ